MTARLLPMVFVVIFMLLLLNACDQSVHATRGFRLPDGDVEHGEKLFDELQCLACHTMDGKDGSDIDKQIETPVALGGKVVLNKTYAELLTSIINPSHRISQNLDPTKVQRNGQSLMRNYNDVITVTELIDLVTFLQTRYELVEPEPGPKY